MRININARGILNFIIKSYDFLLKEIFVESDPIFISDSNKEQFCSKILEVVSFLVKSTKSFSETPSLLSCLHFLKRAAFKTQGRDYCSIHTNKNFNIRLKTYDPSTWTLGKIFSTLIN